MKVVRIAFLSVGLGILVLVGALVPGRSGASSSAKPSDLGRMALTLIRYPYQKIPGYHIEFLPYSSSPGAGVYGVTTFWWGAPGGVSRIYVYPGETVRQIAGVTAFEIGHEVDGAYVFGQGGHGAIEKLLNYHPKSWFPSCVCSETRYLSGWYAASFSNRWSPGVGHNWSSVAPTPSGALALRMEQWLNPATSSVTTTTLWNGQPSITQRGGATFAGREPVPVTR